MCIHPGHRRRSLFIGGASVHSPATTTHTTMPPSYNDGDDVNVTKDIISDNDDTSFSNSSSGGTVLSMYDYGCGCPLDSEGRAGPDCVCSIEHGGGCSYGFCFCYEDGSLEFEDKRCHLAFRKKQENSKSKDKLA